MHRHGLSLHAGDSAQLGCTVYGGSSRVRFVSSNPGVAAVDPATGLVTAVGAGAATVTARTYNGRTARCRVDVDIPDANAVQGRLEVTFLNIGHNDGILLCCDGEYAFFDSGEHPQGVKAKKYLLRRGITHLKYYVGTHGHEDHLGGAPVILEGLDVDTVLVPHKRCIGWIRRWAHGPAERAAAKAANYHIMRPGETIALGSANLVCLGPIHVIKAGTEEGGPENRNSLVLRLTHGVNSFLLCGDALGGRAGRHQPAHAGGHARHGGEKPPPRQAPEIPDQEGEAADRGVLHQRRSAAAQGLRPLAQAARHQGVHHRVQPQRPGQHVLGRQRAGSRHPAVTMITGTQGRAMARPCLFSR